MKLFITNFLKKMYNMLKYYTTTTMSTTCRFILKLLSHVTLLTYYLGINRLLLIFQKLISKTLINTHKLFYFVPHIIYHSVYLNTKKQKFLKLMIGFKNCSFQSRTLYNSLGILRINIGMVFKKTRRYIRSLYMVTWKKLIDFLFFTVYRNRIVIIAKLVWFKNSIVKFIILFILLFSNIIGNLHNYILFGFRDNFMVWDLDSLIGILYFFLTFLNPNNIILLVDNLLMSQPGIYQLLFHSWDYIYLHFGYRWIDLYHSLKSSDQKYNYSLGWFGNFYSGLLGTSQLFSNYDLDNSPLFFLFGTLFFTTVILSWFFFSYLGLYGIFQLNLLTLFMFLVSLMYYAKLIFIDQKVYVIKLCSWVFLSTNVRIDYYFLVDTISYSFMLLTTTIAFFVFIYAFSYFRYEPLVDRFLLFILSFVISMIFLVLSGNTIMLFLGWELIGFTSFCLINFWTTKTTTLKSAFKAFTFNKVSDFYMFIFMVASYTTYYTFDIQTLNNLVYNYESYSIFMFGLQINFLEFLALMLIGAAFIKSAQLGGHAWLPDSMEAPVPASSLIHSATLVSAGVYLILRFNFIFDATQFSRILIPVVGSLTAAYGGVCAAAQSDIKKTLAYSTISHCGFLMVLSATEMNEFTILYLYVHGFFKAGVFMCVGNLLRVTRGYQDNRRMGGLLKFLPFEYFCLVIGVFNLAGLPFTFGFFIKHLLLLSLNTHMYVYYFVMSHCLIGAFSGLFYSYRLSYYTFIDFKKGNKNMYLSLNKGSFNSKYYTNSSIAATVSILSLFLSAYLIVFVLLKCFLANNTLFSDYINTTLLSNYYCVVNVPQGYLLNFSYINATVAITLLYLVLSTFRGVHNPHIIIGIIFSFTALLTLTFSFFILL